MAFLAGTNCSHLLTLVHASAWLGQQRHHGEANKARSPNSALSQVHTWCAVIKTANLGGHKWGKLTAVSLKSWLMWGAQQTSGLAKNLQGDSGDESPLRVKVSLSLTFARLGGYMYTGRNMPAPADICVWTLVLALTLWPLASQFNHSVCQLLNLWSGKEQCWAEHINYIECRT